MSNGTWTKRACLTGRWKQIKKLNRLITKEGEKGTGNQGKGQKKIKQQGTFLIPTVCRGGNEENFLPTQTNNGGKKVKNLAA